VVLPIVQSVITTANNLGAFAKHSPRVFAHAVLIVFTAFFLIGGSTFVNTDTNVQPSSTIVVRSNSINESRSITDDATNIEIAAEVAAQVKLPVAQDVIQYAQVVKAESITSVASSEDALVKPQLVTTNGLEDKEVTTYTVKDGESIDRIASKFDISANTIRWANDISEWSDVTAGQKITILPVNGVIHRVGAGDTPSSLAEKL
jgi:N-acetylmuramoyl-L-alanine amidase